ncbi:unnamed protein product [Rhizoctonia solani]|uniref:F-box domain-containing protein n=1 Tax=Rhizoctonia solani TaxID=456999 RepID=A0A8H2WUW3_9AGAM|nr:unnamed protein product [Rhizoctonia solani]
MATATPWVTGGSETTVSFGFTQQKQGRIHNDMQGINKLPAELLSRIFVIGEASDRSTRPRMRYYTGFQEVVTRVCYRWREVAIGCPILWTYIHITRPSLYRLASLYLQRAGPSSLLDIDLELRTRFWRVLDIDSSDWETQLDKVPHLLRFLISRGATVDRWRSLTVCAKQPDVLYAIIGFINARPARSLQLFSCRWKYWRHDLEGDEEERSLSYPHLFSESFSFSSSMMPKLRSVELNALPWEYVFNRSPNYPLLTKLTNLTLTSAYIPCEPRDLQNLLVSNPELEHLSLNISKQAATAFEGIDPEPGTFRVRLSKLHSLSLSTGGYTGWVASMLPVIEAPALRRFSVSGDFVLLLSGLNLAQYIMGGKLPLQYDTLDDDPGTQNNTAAYPLLDELDISMLTVMTELLLDMLASLPTVTKLHVSSWHVKQLKSTPGILPNLAHLYCTRMSYGHLGELLRNRMDAGFPIGTVHIDRIGLEEVGWLLPEEVEYSEYYPEWAYELDCDESDQGSIDGWEDEDILERSSNGELRVMSDDVYESSDEESLSTSTPESEGTVAND